MYRMKRFSRSFLLILLFLGSMQTLSAQAVSKEDYLELSRQQQKRGFILLGSGAALVIGGGAIFSENFCLFDCTTSSDFWTLTGAVMATTGAVAMVVSIPNFIKSGKNARKAAQLSCLYQDLPGPRISGKYPSSYPALQVRIPLAKAK